ncbi:PEGA domain-containing protein [Cystobacter fuscus]|uniref:PEGA domain-containing protein n=1 Tax=Cystobacter fuscus TaxID=43 RepID=A0A250JB29_9BACT|nr:PEGA domain-containing protein [Cystobacter fuscus]ATB40682.1 PEGA domain-containing protein [Cystobacter fuscus]
MSQEHASQKVAAVLKLGSALCAMAAAGVLILPLVRGEVRTGPRDITLTPITTEDEETQAEEDVEVESAGKPIRETRSAFEGAILSLESQPSEATVKVNGRDQGETPVMVGLECAPGEPVVITFSRRGFESTTHRTPCPRDEMVKVKARLKQSIRGTAGKR